MCHDVKIDHYTKISLGLQIAGNVVVGKDSYIGICASVINGHSSVSLEVKGRALIKAFACVTMSLEPQA